MKRTVVRIDEALCTGCGDCIPSCPEGALQVIGGKVRLVSDLFCDGLGACIKTCPYGAITVAEREAEPYDERRVMSERIVPGGAAVIAAHLEHLHSHGESGFLLEAIDYLVEEGMEVPMRSEACGMFSQNGSTACTGSTAQQFGGAQANLDGVEPEVSAPSHLAHWPVQLHLVSPLAPCYRGADLLLAADCAAFAAGDFHDRFLQGKSLAIACPKLDTGIDRYIDKLVAMIDMAEIRSITVVIMEVPCCGGLMTIVEQALAKSSRSVDVHRVVMSVQGEVLRQDTLHCAPVAFCKE